MAPTTASLDPRTPVVVAVGQVSQRAEDPTQALEPTALLAEAARTAADADGGHALLAGLDTLAVIRILSHRYRDPAALVATDLEIDPCRTLTTDDGGNYPQMLLNRACLEIQAGRSEGWLIGGAETWRSRNAAHAAGLDLGWTDQPEGVEPTEEVRNPHKLFLPHEIDRRAILPAEVYALFENAYRAAKGWTIDEHRDRLGRLWSSFSEVAAANPHAWIREARSPAEIRDPSPDNRMIGFPYTKLMNANNAVEQAACVVVTSVERARAAGIPTDRWVFPWSGSDAHEHWFVSHRWSLASAPAVGDAGRAALALAGLGVDDVDLVDVYSCFPSAVQIAAEELGLSTDRPLTVTGGLSFAGGPWNDYVSHSIATMVERLREQPGARGLITANGGYLTKHAMGIYSAEPPAQPFRHANPQAEVDARPRRELDESVDGPVEVESAVVTFDRGGAPSHALVACLTPEGRRAWGATTDPDAMARFTTVETAGDPGTLDPAGAFHFT